MRKLGLLGGMSWESSIEYERCINRAVRAQLGGAASADLIIRSFNFAEISELQATGQWDAAGKLLIEAAKQLELAGAEAVLICTNTMHIFADQIQQSIGVPLIHIADATGQAVKASGVKKVLLLGTRFTMEKDFYRVNLESNFDLEVSIPSDDDRTEIHRIIYEELVQGKVLDESRDYIKLLIAQHAEAGCQGIIAGCTEIELLV
ncbi:MAG: aspartate/glutamate racemase family protein, partial [Actinomycetes bacterium]